MDRVDQDRKRTQSTDAALHASVERLIVALERLDYRLDRHYRLLDEAIGVYFNAHFTGRGTDRWSGRRG